MLQLIVNNYIKVDCQIIAAFFTLQQQRILKILCLLSHTISFSTLHTVKQTEIQTVQQTVLQTVQPTSLPLTIKWNIQYLRIIYTRVRGWPMAGSRSHVSVFLDNPPSPLGSTACWGVEGVPSTRAC